ncbi:ash family protein [Rouxiella sp. Mn2063]|uniref:ash family protein n=1 Tax=Rouxiella sp. Mn2063 TaxID=3395262 RepID=UPI003BBC5B2E
MVTQAGQPSGWSVSSRTDIPTPAWVATQERRNSGGNVVRKLLEAARWLRL